MNRAFTDEAILVVSPHPDDAEIGMGGTIAKAICDCKKVVSLVLTDGRRSPRSFSCSDEEMAQIREREVAKAHYILGIEVLYYLKLHDLTSNLNRSVAEQKVAEVISAHHPKEIYLPHPELDRHPTHRIAGRLVMDVAKRVSGVTIWAYEVWGLFPSWDRCEDISSYKDRKIEAIRCHQSQISDIDYADGIIGLNRWRAVFANPAQLPKSGYVEAFVRL
ncbi:MAG: PIG-L family deacetylase [Blastocatellia bacterium]|nr:PIG-L family deacetylase [Blastocatellia bacterium]